MAVSIVVTPVINGISVTEKKTTVTATGVALGSSTATAIAINSVAGLSATNVQGALEELAGQNFQQASTPTGSQVSEGDTWYDTDDDQLKIYRETSNGVFQWVPIIVGTADGDSDTLDAGAF